MSETLPTPAEHPSLIDAIHADTLRRLRASGIAVKESLAGPSPALPEAP